MLSIGKFGFFEDFSSSLLLSLSSILFVSSSSRFGFLPKGLGLGRFPNNLLLSKALLSGRSNRLNFLNTIFGLEDLLFLEGLGEAVGAGVLGSLLLGVKRFLGLFEGLKLGESFSEFCSRIVSRILSLKDRPLPKLLVSSSKLDLPREILLLRLLTSLEDRSIFSSTSSSLSA